jgi:hypothetical protein
MKTISIFIYLISFLIVTSCSGGGGGGDNHIPTADAGIDQIVALGSIVTLDGSASVGDGDLFFEWSFVSLPEGSSAILSDPTAVKPTFNVDVDGVYKVDLSVTSDGNKNTDTVTITAIIDRNNPVANAGPDQLVVTGGLVALDGSASNDADNVPLVYFWNLIFIPTGSTAQLSDSSADKPTFIADVAGDYVVRLVVSDGILTSAVDIVTVIACNEKCDEIPTSYTGSKEQAGITNNNAVALVEHLGAYGYREEPIQRVFEIISRADLVSNPRNIDYLRIDSLCGGYYDLTLRWDESTSSFTANVNFTNYCVEKTDNYLYLTGTCPIKGIIKTQSFIEYLHVNFDNLNSQAGDYNHTFISGNEDFLYIPALFADSSYTNKYVVRDNNSQNKNYFTDKTQYKYTILSHGGSLWAFSGRFYDYEYGFVDIENSGFSQSFAGAYESGVMYIVGHESIARLTLTSFGNLLEVDADNDGAFDDGSFANVLWPF